MQNTTRLFNHCRVPQLPALLNAFPRVATQRQGSEERQGRLGGGGRRQQQRRGSWPATCDSRETEVVTYDTWTLAATVTQLHVEL